MEDLSGRFFGNWNVIEKIDRKIGNSKKSEIYWLCKCICGTIKAVSGNSLKRGKSKSCGCIHHKQISKNRFINLINKKFGRLTVIERSNNKLCYDGYERPQWLCQCDCGKTLIVLGDSLRSGNTQSCGCLQEEKSRKSRFIDLTNKTFGLLKVIERYPNKKRVYWKCKCSCGNYKIVRGDSLTSGKTVSCGCLIESGISFQIKKYCKEKYNSISEYKILRNLKTNRFLPYDIYIPNYKIFIEIHGEQHYRRNENWYKTEEEFKERLFLDDIKRKYASKEGIYLEINLIKIKSFENAVKLIEEIILNEQR